MTAPNELIDMKESLNQAFNKIKVFYNEVLSLLSIKLIIFFIHDSALNTWRRSSRFGCAFCHHVVFTLLLIFVGVQGLDRLSFRSFSIFLPSIEVSVFIYQDLRRFSDLCIQYEFVFNTILY